MPTVMRPKSKEKENLGCKHQSGLLINSGRIDAETASGVIFAAILEQPSMETANTTASTMEPIVGERY